MITILRAFFRVVGFILLASCTVTLLSDNRAPIQEQRQ